MVLQGDGFASEGMSPESQKEVRNVCVAKLSWGFKDKGDC